MQGTGSHPQPQARPTTSSAAACKVWKGPLSIPAAAGPNLCVKSLKQGRCSISRRRYEVSLQGQHHLHPRLHLPPGAQSQHLPTDVVHSHSPRNPPEGEPGGRSCLHSQGRARRHPPHAAQPFQGRDPCCTQRVRRGRSSHCTCSTEERLSPGVARWWSFRRRPGGGGCHTLAPGSPCCAAALVLALRGPGRATPVGTEKRRRGLPAPVPFISTPNL